MLSKVEYSEGYPGIATPASRLFSHPSRVADVWVPAIEAVLIPETTVPEHLFTVQVYDGSTADLEIKHWTRNPVRRRVRTRAEPLCLEGLVFDSRWETGRNVTHHLIHPMTFLLHGLRTLRAHDRISESEPVTMVMPPGSPTYLLTMLDMVSVRAIATDKEVKGRILHVESQAASGADRQHYPIPDLFAEDFPGYVVDTPKRIFLSRKTSRTIANEAEVEAFLSSQGFVKVYFEDLPVATQWSMMRNAEEIVGIHGAALGQLLLHRGHATGHGPRVVEIFGAGHTTICFRHYVTVQNGRWCAVRSKITSSIVRDLDERYKRFSHAYDPIQVDPGTIEMALDYLRSVE